MASTASRIRGASNDAQSQIRELRGQVDQLLRERVTPMASDLSGRAQVLAHRASDIAHEQTESFAGQVREMPIAAVLVAAAAGYLLGRLSR